MKTKVDPDLCIGCELCTSTAPDIYEMDGSVAVAIEADVAAEFEDEVVEAKENCPVEAISID